MTKREVIVVILLTIFTCGIYGIYWMYQSTEELNRLEPEEPLMNYILAILLGIVTNNSCQRERFCVHLSHRRRKAPAPFPNATPTRT